MTELSNAVAMYFTPCKSTFWCWSEGQQTIEWISGETIAFRAEVQTLLEAQAAEGLLPFENILLVAAACRNRANVPSWQLGDIFNFKQYPMGHSLNESLYKAVGALETLAQLPENLRTSMEGKKAILTLVAENGPRRKSLEFSSKCLEYLRQGSFVGTTAPAVLKSTSDWSSELRGLHDGLSAVNETAVRLRMKTGLEVTPSVAPAPLPLPIPKIEPSPLTVRELLKDLAEDEEYAGLVRLTQQLLAFVSLPRLLSTPDALQLGGVSDITNRGSFDRLLLSELAHDSDVLMTRVALNEAMYIRREVPPTFPPRQCLILVDTGIRMWGLPRLYATAVALAFAVAEDAKAAPQIFRSTTDGPVAIDLTSRDQLIEHLECLEPAPHPGDSLAQLLSDTQGVPADVIVVTGEDVAADPEFRQSLATLPQTNLYLALVTRKGDLRLTQRTRQGERVLKQAQLDLNQILATPRPKRSKLRNEAIDPQLPAICRVRPFPLYLSPQILEENRGRCIDRHGSNDTVDQLLAVTNDRRLVLWDRPAQCATQLSDRLPPGKLLWHQTYLAPSGTAHVLIGSKSHPRLFKVTASHGADHVQEFELPFASPIYDICKHADILYVVFKSQTVLFSMETCERLVVVEHPEHTRWLRHRFFTQASDWVVLTYDGQTVHWERVFSAASLRGQWLVSIHDCQCLAAPVAVTNRNTVIVSGSGEELQFNSTISPQIPGTPTAHPIDGPHIGGVNNISMQVATIAPDGNRFVMIHPTEKAWPGTWVVDLLARTASPTWGNQPHWLNSVAYHASTRRNIRNKFVSAGVCHGQLVLATHKQTSVAISLSTDRTRLNLQPLEMTGLELDYRSDFRFLQAPSDVGYEFKVAQWADGSRVILDSRGLLHLQSSNAEIPEMTLVLNDENVAGWCNQNEVWGDTVFTGTTSQRISPEKVFDEWLTPFCRRLK